MCDHDCVCYDDDGSAELEAIADALLLELAAARHALRTIRDDGSMDRSERWAILDRFAKAQQAVESERDRAHYGAINARIAAEMRA